MCVSSFMRYNTGTPGNAGAVIQSRALLRTCYPPQGHTPAIWIVYTTGACPSPVANGRPRSLTGNGGLRSTTWYNWAESKGLKIQLEGAVERMSRKESERDPRQRWPGLCEYLGDRIDAFIPQNPARQVPPSRILDYLEDSLAFLPKIDGFSKRRLRLLLDKYEAK